MIPDPHATLRDRVLDRVLSGPGVAEPALRRAAAEGAGLPGDLQTLVEAIELHAYRVTDEDLTRLRASYDDDQLFEIVVSAALGASRRRLAAGLAALERA
jgi:alkylhydroperoxidase family enzyme